HGMLDSTGLGLDPNATYRLRVLRDELELGFADVQVFPTEHLAKSLASEDMFELVDGKKLHIKVYVNKCGAIDCAAATPCRGAGTCDPLTGACAPGIPAPDGSVCGGGGACVASGTCQAGSCVIGSALECDDGDACTNDGCDPASGCTHATVDC